MTNTVRARGASKAVQALSSVLVLALASATGSHATTVVRDEFGAIIRGDVKSKRLSLIFTGDAFGESTTPILDVLKSRRLKGAFFLTGNFLRRSEFKPLVRRMVHEGHYVGPHSDSHPLYCDWDNREQGLVTEAFFTADLRKNIASLRAVGAFRPGEPAYFVPPYEWYNAEHVEWSRKAGVELVNFTPGSGSNRDYLREGEPRFVSSRQILDDILAYERKDPNGLNGFLLLLHLGSGRRDPFHTQLRSLCDELGRRGYEIVRIDALLSK